MSEDLERRFEPPAALPAVGIDQVEHAPPSASIHRASPGVRRAGYHRDLPLDPGAVKELRLFGLAGWAVSAYAKAWLSEMRANWRRRGSLHGDGVLALAAGVIAMSVVFSALVLSFLSGAMSLSLLTIYGQAALGIPSLGPIGDNHTLWRLGGRNLLDPRDLEPDTPDRVGLASRGRRPSPQGAIAFENVTFAYPGGRPVFGPRPMTRLARPGTPDARTSSAVAAPWENPASINRWCGGSSGHTAFTSRRTMSGLSQHWVEAVAGWVAWTAAMVQPVAVAGRQ